MNKTVKTLLALLTVFSLCFFVSAQEPVTYSFSGFGGGLPSSATEVSDSNSLETESTSSSKKTVLTTAIIGGVVIATCVIAIVITSKSTNGACWEEAGNNIVNSCAEGCGEEMGNQCADSMWEGCTSNAFSLAMPIYVP